MLDFIDKRVLSRIISRDDVAMMSCAEPRKCKCRVLPRRIEKP